MCVCVCACRGQAGEGEWGDYSGENILSSDRSHPEQVRGLVHRREDIFKSTCKSGFRSPKKEILK